MLRHVTHNSVRYLDSVLKGFQDHYIHQDRSFTLFMGTHAEFVLKYLTSRSENRFLRLDAQYAEHRIPASAYPLVFLFERVEICHTPSASLSEWICDQARLGNTFPVKVMYVRDLGAYSTEGLSAMHLVFPSLRLLEHSSSLDDEGVDSIVPFTVTLVKRRGITWPRRDRPFDLALDPDDQPLSF